MTFPVLVKARGGQFAASLAGVFAIPLGHDGLDLPPHQGCVTLMAMGVVGTARQHFTWDDY